MEEIKYGNQEIKITDRSSISLTGVNKIISFDDEEFLMETSLGNLRLLGESLELLKLDTVDGIVKIKGTINSLTYLDIKSKNKSDGLVAKLFK